MKKIVLLVFILGCFASVVWGQNTYVGVGVSLPIVFGVGAFPLPGFQVGGQVADHVEIRGTLDTLIVANLVAVDVFYTAPIADANARWYGGGGAGVLGVFIADIGGAVAFLVHAPVGVEYFTSDQKQMGLFGEVQPGIVLASGAGSFLVNVRAGVNFHF